MNNPTSTGSGGGVETDASSKHQLEKPVDMKKVWIEQLESLWDCMHQNQDLIEDPELTLQDVQNCLKKKKDQVSKKFHEALSSMDRQVHHSFVLEVINHSQNLHTRKRNALALLILREFDTMLSVKKMTEEELTRILTPELRMQAFHLAASAHSNVFDILSKLYYLQGLDNSFLVSTVNVMLEKQQFKEAATCVTKLNLHNSFSWEVICLPLIFQDKANMVERYVQGFPELQEALLRQLDVFCEQGYDINVYLSEMKISVPEVRVQTLTRRPMTKLIRRLVEMFELDMSICPNTAMLEIISALKSLINERYTKESMAQDLWEEFILSTIGDNKSVQLPFIQLMENRDVPAAARWARYYGIEVNQLTEAVSEELQRSDASNAAREEQGTSRVEENWDKELPDAPSVDYYPLNLPRKRIILVSMATDIQYCLEDITSEPNPMVGIDMEWKPTFSPTQKSKVALCQIATHETAYLLDMPALWVPETKDIVKSFFQELLQSEDILKLGFGISEDYKMLGQSFPELQEALKGEKRTVDVKGLGEQILKEIQPPGNMRISSLGLTDLVHFCFGKYLNKRDRISDWERRPLTGAQIKYAALDAFCLLEVYAHLEEKVSYHGLQINMDPIWSETNEAISKASQEIKSIFAAFNKPSPGPTIYEVCDNMLEGIRDLLRPYGVSLPNDDEHDEAVQPPQIDACDLAVVCDNMLEGLGRRLSKFGVDVKVLDNGDEHEEAVQISLKEGRAILTTGAPYLALKSRVDDGQIMCVDTDCRKAPNQVRDVLRFFNVLIPSHSRYNRY